jgi:hypothetical protein
LSSYLDDSAEQGEAAASHLLRLLEGVARKWHI